NRVSSHLSYQSGGRDQHPTLHYVHFFLFMPRRPPRPTLFPYTTLFRSGPADLRSRQFDRIHASPPGILIPPRSGLTGRRATGARSEEHTSEPQSRSDLVCRLLLEKKKVRCNQPFDPQIVGLCNLPDRLD